VVLFVREDRRNVTASELVASMVRQNSVARGSPGKGKMVSSSLNSSSHFGSRFLRSSSFFDDENSDFNSLIDSRKTHLHLLKSTQAPPNRRLVVKATCTLQKMPVTSSTLMTTMLIVTCKECVPLAAPHSKVCAQLQTPCPDIPCKQLYHI
jgi:hypothetical protein